MDQPSERRRHPRKKVELELEFQADETPPVAARFADLSIGGGFVQTATPAEFGANLEVRFPLPHLADPIVVKAVVRWTSPDGMGVQFGVLGAKQTYVLSEHLGKV